MKKSIYFLMMFAGLVFTSCEPMEDIHDEIEADIEATPNAGTVDYVFTEEDYDAVGLDDAEFASVDQANELLPEYLLETYPVLQRGSIANLTVDVAEPVPFDVTTEEYEATDEDYEELGLNFGNFDREADLYRLLDLRFPDAEVGTVVELTYLWYAGSVSTVTSDFLKTDAETWTQVMALNGDDYDTMGEAFDNFDSREEAMQKLPVYLNQLNPYAAVNDTENVLFAVHIGGGQTVHFLKTFTFNGSEWGGTFEQTLQFGHNGTTWEPDNTIIYALTQADYEMVGNGNFGNFDYWDQEDYDEAYEKIVTILGARFPDVEEGQKFLVSFLGYSGSVATYNMPIIYTGGEFEKF